jgi:DNA modification methylase
METKVKQLPLQLQTEVPLQGPGLKGLGIDLDKIHYKDKGYLTHNFHPYPAKFIPPIPRAIIERYTTPGQTVCDPFCGSGTTLVEACLVGRPAFGNDLNPIAYLVSVAKTTIVDESHVRELTGLLQKINKGLLNLRSMVDTGLVEQNIPDFKNRDHWFDLQSLRELGYIKAAISGLATSQSRTLAYTAFSAIIVKVSRQESDTRWVAIEKRNPPGFALRSFAEKLADMIPRSVEFSRLALSSARITQCDAASLDWTPSMQATLVLTSPPYMNSYDYYLYHKLRMFWLGYDHKVVQNSEIGSRNRHCDKSEGLESYQNSMKVCLENIKRVLRPSGILAIVIGDTVYQGTLIRMDSVYDELCETVGFRKADSYHYDQRKYTSSFTKGYNRVPKASHILIYSN